MKIPYSQRAFSALWRLRRGLTCGAQGVVISRDNEVLLVRHGYRPGWHFPGGGVEWNEPIIQALHRELEEETGVIIKGTPQLHGIFHAAPCDHIALYLVREWEQPQVPASNLEIREQRFCRLDELPPETTKGARQRLVEIFEGQPVDAYW